MIELRPYDSLGGGHLGWLDTRHHFSFADYYDPQQMGFGTLRVINEDRVAPGMGFGKHPHRDMEIISYVLEGALEHQDTVGSHQCDCPQTAGFTEHHVHDRHGDRHEECQRLGQHELGADVDFVARAWRLNKRDDWQFEVSR